MLKLYGILDSQYYLNLIKHLLTSERMSAVLNVYKYFKNFAHFLPWERTLQATESHHLWPGFGRYGPKLANFDQRNNGGTGNNFRSLSAR